MKIALKKITTVILLLLGFVPAIFVVVFHFQQQAVRHRMREKLEEQLLQTIRIVESEMHWVEKGKEILVNGEMFDIESCKLEDGVYTITGLFDAEETRLVQQFNNWKNLNDGYGDDALAQLFDLLMNFFKTDQKENIFCVPTLSHIHPDIFTRLPHQYKDVLTPPPQARS